MARKSAAQSIRTMLEPGRRLDPGRVWEVVEMVDGSKAAMGLLIECLWDERPEVANRAADALERITRPKPAQAQAWKEPLIGLMAEAEEKKLRWNLALTVPRLELTVPECRRIAATLYSYLEDSSSIVRTSALHGLADLARQDPASRERVLDTLRLAGRSGTPAMRARSRILLKELECHESKRQNRASVHMFD